MQQSFHSGIYQATGASRVLGLKIEVCGTEKNTFKESWTSLERLSANMNIAFMSLLNLAAGKRQMSNCTSFLG